MLIFRVRLLVLFLCEVNFVDISVGGGDIIVDLSMFYVGLTSVKL